MKILITGGTGFIGSHLIPELISTGHEVGILSRKKSIKRASRSFDSVSVYPCDSYVEILDGILDFKPDIVVHLATLYINKHTSKDLDNLVYANISFGLKLLEAMHEAGVIKLINFGSRWQHMNEEMDAAANLYAATKNAFQKLLDYYAHIKSIRYVTLELCDTFGKNDTRKKIVKLLIDACEKKVPLALSLGEQILDLLSVDDVVHYVESNLCRSEFFNNTSKALSGHKISLIELGTIIEKIYDVKGFFLWGARPYREQEVMFPPKFHNCVNISSASLEEQIKKQFQ